MADINNVFGKECDPNTINELHKKALQHGRNSKQFIDFSNEIFAYWRLFYAAAVKIDQQTKEIGAEVESLKKDAELLTWVEKNAVDVRCVTTEAGFDDKSYQWAVIEHHMGEPRERQIGRGYGEDKLREAIQAAMIYHAFG